MLPEQDFPVGASTAMVQAQLAQLQKLNRIFRRVRQLILVLYSAVLLGAVAMVIGPYLNDQTINADPGRALARVTHVSTTRTTVDFQDAEGVLHSPPDGLLYPGGLGEGQMVWVTYAKSNPELVKVEGRTWRLALLPALSVAAIATVIAGLLLLFVRRRARMVPCA